MGVVLVTGATSGFGLEIVKIFAKNSYKVIAIGRREDRLEGLKNLGSNILTYKLDVRDKISVFETIENLPQDFKDIEILVNNAGLALGMENSNEASLDDWETMIDTNIKGLLYITKAVLKGMIERENGYIFNIGSTAGNWAYEGANVYGGTKSFVKQFSLNLRTDVRGKNIRVSNIEPGLAQTEFSLVRFKGDTKKAKAVYENLEALKASDIANIIYYCSKLPKRVNINSLEVMPTIQTLNGTYIQQTTKLEEIKEEKSPSCPVRNFFNVSKTDQTIRALLGSIIIILGLVFENAWGFLGLLLLLSAASRICPLYFLFSTNDKENKEEKGS